MFPESTAILLIKILSLFFAELSDMLHFLFYAVQILLHLFQMLQKMEHNLSTRNMSFVYMSETPIGTKGQFVHRGQVVRVVVDKSGMYHTDVAARVQRSRTSLYRDYEDPNMDWQLILKIGAVIDHDFKEEFPEIALYEEQFIREEADHYKVKNDALDRAIKEIDKWKSKAYENLAEATKWKDLYYELLVSSGKLKKVP